MPNTEIRSVLMLSYGVLEAVLMAYFVTNSNMFLKDYEINSKIYEKEIIQCLAEWR